MSLVLRLLSVSANASFLQSMSRNSTAQCVWFHILGSILCTHCVGAVNSQCVPRISAVFGPILELTQETGPFWQPPCQLVLYTAAPEPSVACTHIHKHVQMYTCAHTPAHALKHTFFPLTTHQCLIHLIDFHESFKFLFKSTCLPSSLSPFFPLFHKV